MPQSAARSSRSLCLRVSTWRWASRFNASPISRRCGCCCNCAPKTPRCCSSASAWKWRSNRCPVKNSRGGWPSSIRSRTTRWIFLKDFGGAFAPSSVTDRRSRKPFFAVVFGLHTRFTRGELEFNRCHKLLCDSNLRRTGNCIDAGCVLGMIQHLNNIILCPCGHRLQYIVVLRYLQAGFTGFWAVEAQNLVLPALVGRSSGCVRMFTHVGCPFLMRRRMPRWPWLILVRPIL